MVQTFQTAEELKQELLSKLVHAHVMACLNCGLSRAFTPIPEIRDQEPDCKHCKIHILCKRCFEVNPFKCRNFAKFWQTVSLESSKEVKE